MRYALQEGCALNSARNWGTTSSKMRSKSCVPKKRSTSGISSCSSLRYRSERQPATYTLRTMPCFFNSTASKIALIDSFFAWSINPHVLMMTVSARSASTSNRTPRRESIPPITSESTVFFSQPKVITATLRGELVDSMTLLVAEVCGIALT